MKLNKTIQFKIQEPTKNKRYAFNQTMREWNNCVNFHIAGLREDKTQKELYESSKQKWSKLNTALIQTARDKAKEKISSQEKGDHIAKTAYAGSKSCVRYDQRTVTLKDKNGTILAGISTTNGKKYAPILGGDRNENILRDRDFDFQQADLIYKEDKDEYYLHIAISKKVDIPDTNECDTFVGVDMGIGNIATISAWDRDGNHLGSKNFSSNKMLEKRRRFRKTRKALQCSGLTDKLKEFKNRESRYVEDQCHKISRRIVDFAEDLPGETTIVMENLTNIRKNVGGTKEFNRNISSWPFANLQEFVAYKAHESGISYRKVNPTDTSSCCTDCKTEVKTRGRFHLQCLTCRRMWHRDWLASKNTVRRLFSYMLNNLGHGGSGPKRGSDDSWNGFACASSLPDSV
jgi:IS605 OrfB family transposase